MHFSAGRTNAVMIKRFGLIILPVRSAWLAAVCRISVNSPMRRSAIPDWLPRLRVPWPRDGTARRSWSAPACASCRTSIFMLHRQLRGTDLAIDMLTAGLGDRPFQLALAAVGEELAESVAQFAAAAAGPGDRPVAIGPGRASGDRDEPQERGSLGVGALEPRASARGTSGSSMGLLRACAAVRPGPGGSRRGRGGRRRSRRPAGRTGVREPVPGRWRVRRIGAGVRGPLGSDARPGELRRGGRAGDRAGTAREALVDRGRLRAGETVLITAAAGGVGSAAVQIAAAVGARPLAVASPGNHDWLRSIDISQSLLENRAEAVDRNVSRSSGAGRGVPVL